MSERIKFAVAMGKVFRRAEDDLKSFGAQLKALSSEDKKYYHAALVESGLDVEEPQS